jgi:hypothetical protein
MSPETFIIDADKVLARFGKWPSFHDMEIVSVHMERGGTDAPWMEIVIFVWGYTGGVTPDGYYEQTKHSLVRFRCEQVAENQFENFNHQNVLIDLEFSHAEDERRGVIVSLPSIYGFGGTLNCSRVRVMDVVPATPDGRAAGDD